MIEKIIGLLLTTNITVEEMEEIKDYLEQLYKYGKMNGSTIILMLI